MPWPPQPDGPGTPWPGRCRNHGPEQERRCPDTSAARSAGAAPPGAARFPALPSGSPPRSASAFPTGSGSDQRPIPASTGSTTSGGCRRSSRHRESTPGLPAAADAGPPSPRSARHPASPRSGPAWLLPRPTRSPDPGTRGKVPITGKLPSFDDVMAAVTYPETVDLARVLAMPRWRSPAGRPPGTFSSSSERSVPAPESTTREWTAATTRCSAGSRSTVKPPPEGHGESQGPGSVDLPQL